MDESARTQTLIDTDEAADVDCACDPRCIICSNQLYGELFELDALAAPGTVVEILNPSA